MNKIHSIETLCTYHSKLQSPLEVQEQLYLVAQNGDVLKYADDILSVNASISNLLAQTQFIIIGQPSSIAFNPVDEEFLVSDFAHQSVIFRHNNPSGVGHNLANEISHYKGEALLGPHTAIFIDEDIYFTDSGPFCESSLESPTVISGLNSFLGKRLYV